MSSSIPPLVEAYLVVDQPRQRSGHWAQVLAPLDSSHAPPFAQLVAFYDPTADAAILWLRYDELALGPDRLAYLVAVAVAGEIGMIQPAELSDSDRRRFVHDRLARCTLRIDGRRSVVQALAELVKVVRDAKAAQVDTPARATKLGTVKRPGSVPPIPPLPRGTRDDVASAPPVLAKASRDLPALETPEPPAPPRTDLPRADRARDHLDRSTPPPIPEPARTTTKKPGSGSGSHPRLSQHLVVRGKGSGSHAALVEQPFAAPAPAPSGTPVSPTTAPLVPASDEPGLPDAETRVTAPPRTRRLRSPSQVGTEPYLPSTTNPAPAVPTTIYARYLRSGRWVPIRIGALSLKGAALMTGALPRLHDHVDVALSFGGHRALVRGAVGQVTTEADARTTGAAAFNVRFELDDTSRRQLTSLLTAARAANITIKPPPPRTARRLPVEWPVGLGTTRGVIRAQALDVSRDGLFVRPSNPLVLDASLAFSAVLDDGGAPIAGRAKVVRHISDAIARSAGLVAGYGLHVVDMGDADRARWLHFVTRIEQRADRRVLVGAPPARLAELQAQLAGAGYAVTGGTDPGALVQLARGETRPVDAAAIDASFLAPTMSAAWLESLFSERGVPCVTLRGDARGARAAVDKLLGITAEEPT